MCIRDSSRPQNASRRKKNFHFQLSSAAWTIDLIIILLLSSPTGATAPTDPPSWLCHWCVSQYIMGDFGNDLQAKYHDAHSPPYQRDLSNTPRMVQDDFWCGTAMQTNTCTIQDSGLQPTVVISHIAVGYYNWYKSNLFASQNVLSVGRGMHSVSGF